jgi:hypothetical protein
MADKPELASRSMFHGQEAGFYMKIFLHPLDDYNDQFTAPENAQICFLCRSHGRS